MVTIRQLAKEIGLSPTTISMVLNSSPLARSIPEKTKNRVRAAAKKLGYIPNPFALSLFSSRSATVAILLSDITDPYCATVLKGIDASLFRSNYLPVLLDIENSRAKFRRSLQKLVARRIEGIIGVANSTLLQTELLTSLKKRKIPIVLIGRDRNQFRFHQERSRRLSCHETRVRFGASCGCVFEGSYRYCGQRSPMGGNCPVHSEDGADHRSEAHRTTEIARYELRGRFHRRSGTSPAQARIHGVADFRRPSGVRCNSSLHASW